jgi:Cdc6-like AAA superfamily ATPase
MSRSDTVYAFMEWLKSSRALVEYPGGSVPVEDLYPHYTRYCDYIDADPEEQRKFTERLKKLGYIIVRPKNIAKLKGYVLVEEKLREAFQKLTPVEEGGD